MSLKRPSAMALSKLPRSQYSMMILHDRNTLRDGQLNSATRLVNGGASSVHAYGRLGDPCGNC